MHRLTWHWLGRAPYRRVLADQLAARERVWAGGDGVVLLCEHPPVITLGRSADRANILATPAELTAAHRTLPFGTKLKVTNQKNGKTSGT